MDIILLLLLKFCLTIPIIALILMFATKLLKIKDSTYLTALIVSAIFTLGGELLSYVFAKLFPAPIHKLPVPSIVCEVTLPRGISELELLYTVQLVPSNFVKS